VTAGRRRPWRHDGMDLSVPLPVIGIVHTSHAELEATPIQAGLNRAEHGTIEIAGCYQEGLGGLAEFDYAWLMTWLHRLAEPGSDPPLRHVPFLLRSQQRSKGIFATGGQNGSTPSGSASSRSST
jgi:tRNA (adenine37-N6)-methyltransferase